MTSTQSAQGTGAARPPGPVSVLADRMAAALVHHEPGWRLPRLSALARRYNVTTAQADAAVDELVARHLVRRLPDGQVYRASPAAYLVPLEGFFGLASRVDPMGGQLACKTRTFDRRPPPEDIRRSLGLSTGESVLVIRCLWTVGGEPAALSVSYLPGHLAGAVEECLASLPGSAVVNQPADAGLALSTQFAASPVGILFPWLPASEWSGRPHALQLEMGLPPPSAARSLRITAGAPVTMVTVSFGESAAGCPQALTMAMLRPELFRVVLETSAPAGTCADGLASAWTQTLGAWEP